MFHHLFLVKSFFVGGNYPLLNQLFVVFRLIFCQDPTRDFQFDDKLFVWGREKKFDILKKNFLQNILEFFIDWYFEPAPCSKFEKILNFRQLPKLYSFDASYSNYGYLSTYLVSNTRWFKVQSKGYSEAKHHSISFLSKKSMQ